MIEFLIVMIILTVFGRRVFRSWVDAQDSRLTDPPATPCAQSSSGNRGSRLMITNNRSVRKPEQLRSELAYIENWINRRHIRDHRLDQLLEIWLKAHDMIICLELEEKIKEEADHG